MNYHLDWQVNLADHLVAIAPYGGPVGKNLAMTNNLHIQMHVSDMYHQLIDWLFFILTALLPKSNGKKSSGKTSISIYTIAGNLISTIPVRTFIMWLSLNAAIVHIV